MGRRGYLGLGLTAATVGGASWLSRWLGSPADEGIHALRRRLVWRDTLPARDWQPSNHLLLHHEPFDRGASTLDTWQRNPEDGAPHELIVDDGELLIRNTADGGAIEGLVTPVAIRAPWVAVAATVPDRSRSTTVAVGFVRDPTHLVTAGIGPGGPRLSYRFGDREATIRGSGSAPSAPFELLVLLMGDRLASLTREPGADWVYRGHLGWRGPRVGVDLFDQAEWARWNPTCRVDTTAGDRVTVSDVRVCHTLQFGVRDPTVVTLPDGAPLVRDDELFLTVTCGSVDHRGYQAVLGLDLETYDVAMHAALWAESLPGYISNYVASHLMYLPDDGEFRQCWSGFGNGPREPFWNQKCWVSRTNANLLSGTHVVECELMHLPWGWSGRQHDPVVVRDDEADAWRCVHTSEAIHRITVSETTDDSWTDGWVPVASYRDLVHQIEGGKLARIDGDIVLSYADEGSPNRMVTASYPDPASGRRWIDVDVPPGDVAPHPSLVAIPADSGSKCLLITMDGETVFGLGEPSHGALIVYESPEGPGS